METISEILPHALTEEPTSSRRWRRICEAMRALRVVEIVRDTFTEHRSIGQTLGEWDAAGEGKNQALRRILKGRP